jgi:hypothetical protein
MKWTSWLIGCLAAALMAGCGGDKRNTDTGAVTTDTASGAQIPSDSTPANQTKSGVTDTRTGESTLGNDVTKTSPDQGQPVTSKGDTLKSGGDSVPSSNQ